MRVCIHACVRVLKVGVLERLVVIERFFVGFRGRRTSIKKLTKHHQLIRPVIRPAARKHG